MFHDKFSFQRLLVSSQHMKALKIPYTVQELLLCAYGYDQYSKVSVSMLPIFFKLWFTWQKFGSGCS